MFTRCALSLSGVCEHPLGVLWLAPLDFQMHARAGLHTVWSCTWVGISWVEVMGVLALVSPVTIRTVPRVDSSLRRVSLERSVR